MNSMGTYEGTTVAISKISGPNSYEVRVWENGRQRRRRFRTKKEAEAYEQSVKTAESARRNGLAIQREPITYSVLCERFLDGYRAQSRAWFTDMLDYSKTRFGEVQVRNLRSDEIQAWLADLPLSSKTQKHALDAMRRVLSAGTEWGYLSVSPARAAAVRCPRQTPPDIRPFTSWAEVDELAENIGGYAHLVRFNAAVGLRLEELLPLRWADVDIADRTCAISKVYVKGHLRTDVGKNDSAFRVVRLQQRAIDSISDLPRPLKQSSLLFPAARGGFLDLNNWRRRVWHPALSQAGLAPRPPYQLRHTFATLALAAGADIYWLSEQLGHRDIRTTLRHYARFLPSIDVRNLERLDEFEVGTVSDSCQLSVDS